MPSTQVSEFVLANQESVSYKEEKELNQRPDVLTRGQNKMSN